MGLKHSYALFFYSFFQRKGEEKWREITNVLFTKTDRKLKECAMPEKARKRLQQRSEYILQQCIESWSAVAQKTAQATTQTQRSARSDKGEEGEAMKVYEFFNITKGSRHLRFSDEEKSMCGRDFWGKYRNTGKWQAEIEEVRLIAKRAETDGMFFDGVECVITLKK